MGRGVTIECTCRRVLQIAVEDGDGVAGEVAAVVVDGGVDQPSTGRGLQPGKAVPAQPI